jgi:hypothetical protein
MTTDTPLHRWQRLALLLIVALAFVLRFGGLDHDLHEWQVYHPDTPKQIRAVERFLDGQYYIHYGDLDYDAYPYFNSHLIEYLVRATSCTHDAVQKLVGLPATGWRPDYYELFWITRAWNALLATLLVLVVFQLGRENWDVRAGLAAALLLAVSPADVDCAHFAGADTTAGFFATLTVFFAFRIYRLGRWRDYALAALCTALGFSTKYHAGMALLPVLLAHGLRTGAWRALVQRPALLRLGLLALIGIPATLLSTPTLLTHFTETVTNIWHFFSQISSYRGVDASIRYGGWGGKLAFAMHRNLPILAWILSPLVCLGALLGLKDLLRRHPDPRAVILLAMPLFYFLVGVSLRPMAHPIYHTLMTPLVFVIAAVVFTRPFGRPEQDRHWQAVLRLGALAGAVALLLNAAAKEDFFFSRQDASRLTRAWAEENVPVQFAMRHDPYSFESQKFTTAESNAVGLAWAMTRPEEPPPDFKPVKQFSLEAERMAVFRNIPVRFYVNSNAWLLPDFQMPVFQRAPSRDGNTVICDNGVEFLRSEKRLALTPAAQPVERWLVRRAPLTQAWLAVRNGSTPNLIECDFGGARHAQALAPGEVVWWPVVAPRANWPHEPGHQWYRWTAGASYGAATALLATQPEEIGAFLFSAGRTADAAPFLATAAAATHNPALAMLAARCRTGDLSGVAPFVEAPSSSDYLKIFGITPDYLNALEFIDFPVTECGSVPGSGVGPVSVDGQPVLAVSSALAAARPEPPYVLTPLVQLDAGAYAVTLHVRPTESGTPLRWRLTALDRAGNAWCDAAGSTADTADQESGRIRFAFQVPPGAPELRLQVRPETRSGFQFSRLEIKPDVTATLQGLRQPVPATAPLRVVAAGVTCKVDTLFQGGLRLVDLKLSAASVRRGTALGVDFQFLFEQPDLNLADLAVFVHIVNAAGDIVLQGDYGLADLLDLFAPRLTAPSPWQRSIAVPAGTPPGSYRIQIGLCRIVNADRLRIVASPHTYHVKAVELPAEFKVTD